MSRPHALESVASIMVASSAQPGPDEWRSEVMGLLPTVRRFLELFQQLLLQSPPWAPLAADEPDEDAVAREVKEIMDENAAVKHHHIPSPQQPVADSATHAERRRQQMGMWYRFQAMPDDRLSPQQHVVVRMRHGQGMQLRAIAESLKCGVSTISSQLSRARQKLDSYELEMRRNARG